METQFVTDHQGNQIAVILPMKKYHQMIEDLEDAKDIELYEQAKLDNEPSLPIDEAFEMIEQMRKSNQ